MMPATFARMSMRDPAAATTRSTSSCLVTSAVTSSAVSPACSRAASVSPQGGLDDAAADHLGALTTQPQGRCPSDPASRPGHDRDLACVNRIDEIVPPGTNLNPADGGWANPALQPAARRR
jgi:hypothetical protein